MHSLSSVYFVNQPLHVSGIFVAHHQEEPWSVEHRVFAVETIFKNKDSVAVTQLIFRRRFNIYRNECHWLASQEGL
jgi:hypothetical protein